VRGYQADRFGNRAPTWNSFSAFAWEGYDGLVHVRNRVAGGKTYYNIPSENVIDLWRKLHGGYTDTFNSGWYISAMAPHEYNLIQGEVTLFADGPWMMYSTVKNKPMRDALAEQASIASGIMVSSLLRQHMDPSSYDWLQELFVLYEDHVVEFSTFSKNWGTIPHRNTVFWEVRRY